jgi:hypothetical protein
MDKFTVVGFSTFGGKLKLRFANDLVTRYKVLQRNGHTDATLMELAAPTDKITAAKALAERFDGRPEVLEAVTEFLGKRKTKVQPVEA